MPTKDPICATAYEGFRLIAIRYEVGNEEARTHSLKVAEQLQKDMPPCSIIVIPSTIQIETMDEENMGRMGWVREKSINFREFL